MTYNFQLIFIISIMERKRRQENARENTMLKECVHSNKIIILQMFIGT